MLSCGRTQAWMDIFFFKAQGLKIVSFSGCNSSFANALFFKINLPCMPVTKQSWIQSVGCRRTSCSAEAIISSHRWAIIYIRSSTGRGKPQHSLPCVFPSRLQILQILLDIYNHNCFIFNNLHWSGDSLSILNSYLVLLLILVIHLHRSILACRKCVWKRENEKLG